MPQQGAKAARPQATRPKVTLPVTAKAKANTKASTEKAKVAFRNFSLSRFGNEEKPHNYVERGTHALAIHREVMARQLEKVAPEVVARRRVTFSLPAATLEKFIPGFNLERKTQPAANLLALLRNFQRGHQFTARGEPTFRRIALQAEIDRIIASIKGGAK